MLRNRRLPGVVGVVIPVIFLAAVATAALGNRLSQPEFPYRSEALVGPVSIVNNPDRVPLVSALIAERQLTASTDFRIIAETRLVRVLSFGEDPIETQAEADLVADRIASELNRSELGEFKVFERASPARGTRKRSPVTDLAAGSLAGGYFVLSAFALRQNHRGRRGAHDLAGND